MHPTGFAVWFGLLATALNLFPAGQLDGGHIVHAIVGRVSRYVTIASILVLLTLAVFVSTSWAVWSVLLVLMTYAFGLDHPAVGEEHLPHRQGTPGPRRVRHRDVRPQLHASADQPDRFRRPTVGRSRNSEVQNFRFHRRHARRLSGEILKF